MSFVVPPGRGGPQFIPRPEIVRVGRPAPWAGRPVPDDIDRISAIVAASTPHRPPAVTVDGRPPSAVLVPLFDGPSGPELLFTRRAWHLRSHSGEVCFPGGRHDPTDRDLVSTALREAEEEIGLDASAVTVVGELDRLTTVSSPSFIVPIVARVDGEPALRIADAEVDAVLRVSLAELADPGIYREELWTRGGVEAGIHFFELVGDTLWGATARMVLNLLELVTKDGS